MQSGRLGALAACLLALLLVAATFGAGMAHGQPRPAEADAAITLQVRQSIARDPLLKRMRIEVQTRNRVVRLTGSVRSLDDIAKAGELAGGVRGVWAVRNGLHLEDRPSRA